MPKVFYRIFVAYYAFVSHVTATAQGTGLLIFHSKQGVAESRKSGCYFFSLKTLLLCPAY